MFEPAEETTAAFVVTWKGRLIGERYSDGITMHTPTESWSMGKSVFHYTATRPLQWPPGTVGRYRNRTR